MIWALIEVVLPMLLTFLFGLLTGWLWWRRAIASNDRRTDTTTTVHSSAMSAAEAACNESFPVSEEARAGRTMQEQALAKELTAANASIRSLVAELDVTKTQLQSYESQLRLAECTDRAAAGADVSLVVEDGEPTPAVSGALNAAAATERLQHLQQKYQELESSHSVDRAELAKKQHLEARLNSLTRELADNKEELATVRKAASQLQAEVEALSVGGDNSPGNSFQSGVSARSPAMSADTCQAELAVVKSRLAEVAPVAAQARNYQSQVAALQARLQQSESQLRMAENSGQRIDQLDSQLQTRLAEELEKAKQKVAELEQKAKLSTDKAAELVRTRSRIATLESELGEANSRAEDAERLQQRVTTLESMLKGSEVKAVNERLIEAEAQLRIANNRVADQQQQILALQKNAPDELQPTGSVEPSVDPVVPADSEPLRRQRGGTPLPAELTSTDDSQAAGGSSSIREASEPAVSETSVSTAANRQSVSLTDADFNATNDRAANYRATTDGTTTDTRSTTAKPGASATIDTRRTTAKPEARSGKAKDPAPAWQAGVTRFGTPAANHKDDLKVIRGIGPVLERTLNDAEIQTWDQLAALSADEVELIEQSIDFPGRMTREKWVEQATELVAMYPDPTERPSGRKLLPKKS